jgi:hypothetical protein
MNLIASSRVSTSSLQTLRIAASTSSALEAAWCTSRAAPTQHDLQIPRGNFLCPVGGVFNKAQMGDGGNIQQLALQLVNGP